jgi:hypothetical protein
MNLDTRFGTLGAVAAVGPTLSKGLTVLTAAAFRRTI